LERQNGGKNGHDIDYDMTEREKKRNIMI